MLDMEKATSLAQKFLDEKVSHAGMTFALVEGERIQVGRVFYFDCQSVAYLRSGDLRDMAVGTGYVCVDGETGECRMLGAAESARLDLF
ncbi:YrhB domain-containing protein [Streptomyces apricus]|uniref:Immunity protein 35 domain-containing protein n=1 Tax=Streptomyces apricus TaxID=1828112 RepID=A0A5B0B195_9ACTN|nr:YrhB domain-containing protein [Streptomyces apricus]KAA0935311.1 hypothetical protein FGF04_14520 [Streptomyces apricus]